MIPVVLTCLTLPDMPMSFHSLTFSCRGQVQHIQEVREVKLKERVKKIVQWNFGTHLVILVQTFIGLWFFCLVGFCLFVLYAHTLFKHLQIPQTEWPQFSIWK